ncbi:MAG: PKD domain-containing protein [Candidatus Alcyoniella australis]|nr:PKD domain-containing protein [Candidatus Alcyoniella australis]
MKRIQVLLFSAALCLMVATGAVAQEQGVWEIVYSSAMAGNSAMMYVAAPTAEDVYTAGLHQDSALSIVYAWDSHNGGTSWSPMYRISMDGSDPCSMMDMMSFMLATDFTDGDNGVIVGMGVPPSCKELGMPLCMACIFMLKAMIMHTSDGGQTFNEASLPGVNAIFKTLQTVDFPTATIGYAAGAPNYIVATYDAGLNWGELPIIGDDEEMGINDISFSDALNGYAATGNLDPEEPEDKGYNLEDPEDLALAWYEMIQYMRDPIYRLNYKAENGRGKGVDGKVYRTTDGGLNWDVVLSNANVSFGKIHSTDADHAWTLAWPREGTATTDYLYYTSDGGENWDQFALPQTLEIPSFRGWSASDLFFVDEDKGFIVGGGGAGLGYCSVILFTEDGGENWELDPFRAKYPLLGVDFYNSKRGFSVGMNLAVARYTGPNLVPVADAGADQEVHVGDTVQLDGSESYDPDEDPLNFIWSQPGGPIAEVDNTTIELPSFEATEVGVLTFELIVTDGTAMSVPDQVEINVLPPDDDDDDDDDDDSSGDDDDSDKSNLGGGCGC